METKTGFDLNQSIGHWRDSLAQSAALRVEALDELEHHLRDSMAELRARQLSEEESFLIATHRLGGGEALTREFSKVNPSRVWPTRLCWMIAGIFLYQWMGSVSGTGTRMLIQYVPTSVNGHWLGLFIVLIDWIVLLAPVFGFLWLMTARPKLVARWSQHCVHHPVLTAIGLLISGAVAFAVTQLPVFLFARNFGTPSPEALARWQTTNLWRVFGYSLLQNILLPFVVVYLARRALKPRLAK